MNLKQFNLYKNAKKCRKANLTETDYNKNQEYLYELLQAEIEYYNNIEEIKLKYTLKQQIITDAYNYYASTYSGYGVLLGTGCVLLFPIALTFLTLSDYSEVPFELVIPLGIIGILSLGIGLYCRYKTRKLNKLK